MQNIATQVGWLGWQGVLRPGTPSTFILVGITEHQTGGPGQGQWECERGVDTGYGEKETVITNIVVLGRVNRFLGSF